VHWPRRLPRWRCVAGAAQAQQQGVSKNEIVLGSIQDLSGPIAASASRLRNGMQLRVDEINEQGGINGRKIKLLVEDSGYDPKKAVLAAQKLVNQDKIFIDGRPHGHAQNNAAMPVQFEKNVINFLPVTAAREMYEPFHKLKFAAATYYDQMRVACRAGEGEECAKRVHRSTRTTSSAWRCARRRGRPEGHGHGDGREDHLQARRHRLLVAGGADEGRQLRPGRAGHHHPRDHRHHRRVAARPASARPSWAPARPTPT
jgi:hypothetical protein